MTAAAGWAWGVGAAAGGGAARAWRERRRGRELVARACHELRGPLTAAHLALQAETRGGLPAGARIAAVELELRRAGLALEDLAAARTGGGAADRPEIVDVADLLAYQAATWEAIAPVFDCELRVGGAPCEALVRGDRVRLAQAVGNLLANALEHGAGRVELGAGTQAGRVRIEVADEGAALPAPFAELARRPRAGRGRRGRGLAIAADIVARHGGRRVSAPRGRGARLAIELPAWTPEVGAIGSGSGAAR